MHNHVILTGRLTSSPELKQTPSGISVCRCNIAVHPKYNKNKEEQETDFFEIEAWRNIAEFISRYLKKGDLIDITGRLKTSRWNDDNGITHYKTFVVVTAIDFSPTNNRVKEEQSPQNNSIELSDFESITDDLTAPF